MPGTARSAFRRSLLTSVRELVSLRWQPGWDTVVALSTEAAMIGLYYVNFHARDRAVSLVLFVVVTNGLLNVIVPAYYVLKVRHEPLRCLGLTTRWWWLALLCSVLVALSGLARLQEAIAARGPIDALPHILTNGTILWEPFFVFGWLQLRFERAFGVIPGIVLAGGSFAAYHVGSYPSEIVWIFLLAATVDAAIFRITRNLLSMWPLTWAVTSSTGTLRGPRLFGWDDLLIRLVLLFVQGVLIGWLVRARGPARDGEQTVAL